MNYQQHPSEPPPGLASWEEEEIHWIEATAMNENKGSNNDHDDEPERSLTKLFADPDPLETFSLTWHVPSSSTTTTPADKTEDTEVDDTQTAEIACTTTRRLAITVVGHKMELGQTLSSTGLTLWKASRLLCDYMVSHVSEITGSPVILELGAGLGLCGIVAARLGASRVILTDGDSDTLTRMRTNVAASARPLLPECRQLIWQPRPNNTKNETSRNEYLHRFMQQSNISNGVPLILGADICYMEESLEPLWNTMDLLLSKEAGGQVWLAYTFRNVAVDSILAEAQEYGFVCQQTPLAGTLEGIYVFVRRQQPTILAATK